MLRKKLTEFFHELFMNSEKKTNEIVIQFYMKTKNYYVHILIRDILYYRRETIRVEMFRFG